MLSRQPLEQAIENAQRDADHQLKSKLELARDLRLFSVQVLGLPNNQSYSSYVALDRDFPVWTVVAAEEFSVAPKSWCFPFVGCTSYRGYFSAQAADHYADFLVRQGLETTVGGVGAYSTLGWFDDPLLPSMMRYGDAEFAEILFHELAHQQLYIKGNSAFSEAFATVVGEQGAILWLKSQHSTLLDEYQKRVSARGDFSNLLAKYKQRLATLYKSKREIEEMRELKNTLFISLETDYQTLKSQRWRGVGWFDQWFKQPINNARLAAFSTYRDQVPEFVGLLAKCNTNFSDYFASLSTQKNAGENAIVPQQCVVFERGG